jgi:hypothetical protein
MATTPTRDLLSDPALIQCTPPTDPAFLAAANAAIACARALMVEELAVVVGAIVMLRASFPKASVTVATVAGDDGPTTLWLIARDGWVGIEPSVSEATARRGPTRNGGVSQHLEVTQ